MTLQGVGQIPLVGQIVALSIENGLFKTGTLGRVTKIGSPWFSYPIEVKILNKGTFSFNVRELRDTTDDEKVSYRLLGGSA